MSNNAVQEFELSAGEVIFDVGVGPTKLVRNLPGIL